jgi:hypothetical protein
MLPDGWGFENPRNGDRPWVAATRPGGRWERDGVSLEIQAESKDKAVEAARVIEAAAAAIPAGWSFNRPTLRGGFIP